MPAFHDLVVSRLDPLTADAAAITLTVPDELREAYSFKPGQHLTFRHYVDGVEARRSFSICTTPASGRLQVALKYLPKGVFSQFVRDQLKPGDTLSVMTPVGRFSPRSGLGEHEAEPGANRSYGAVVAGSGITPVMSILTSLLETEPTCTFVLLYGNQSAGSVMFAEEIADLKDRFLARLHVIHVLSREQHDAPLLSGRIDQAKLDMFLTLQPPETVDEWFLCGPAGLVQQASAALIGRGAEKQQVHTELYYTGVAAPVARTPSTGPFRSKVTVRLDGRTTTFDMPETGSILDAVLSVRPDAPFACRGGVCGTCRVRLLEGEVEMVQNFALDQQDLDAGFRLACQSVPLSTRVCVDFDT